MSDVTAELIEEWLAKNAVDLPVKAEYLKQNPSNSPAPSPERSDDSPETKTPPTTKAKQGNRKKES